MNSIQVFIDWVKAGNGNRNISIEIGKSGNKDYFSLWTYDFGLQVGKFNYNLENVDLESIDLEKVKIDQEKAEYEKLKSKYEGEVN